MFGLLIQLISALTWNIVEIISYFIGSNVPATRLLISIFLAYPTAIIYDNKIRKRSLLEKKLFFFLTGLDIGFFNFGTDIYHMFIPIIVFYASLKVLQPGKFHTITTFVFTMSYLLIGYYCTESENYDITWTMPLCILVLRLIAIAYDLWDGTVPQEKLSSSFKKTALHQQPSFLDILACSFFPASVLVGPQFSLKRFYDYVNGKYDKHRGYKTAAAYTLILGVIYLAIHQALSIYFPTEYMLSKEFNDASFWYKHIYIGFWGKATLSKYIACWLIAEASCTRFGLSYQETGIDRNPETAQEILTTWEGCSNIKIRTFELATRFGHYIDSFNVNTNLWSAQYVYKRCAFLGNKYISQALTIFFLAVWHGLHSGYYMTFFMEFLIMFMEKQAQPLLEKYNWYHSLWSNKLSAAVLFTFLKAYTIIFMGWCMIPFDLKCSHKWWQVYKTLYCSGFVFFFSTAVIFTMVLPKVLPPKRQKTQ